MEHIAVETNRYASQKIKSEFSNKSRLNFWNDTDSVEIERFLRIALWMRLVKYPKITDYWSKKPMYANKLNSVMSRNRFELLLRMIHFNDNEQCDNADVYINFHHSLKN